MTRILPREGTSADREFDSTVVVPWDYLAGLDGRDPQSPRGYRAAGCTVESRPIRMAVTSA